MFSSVSFRYDPPCLSPSSRAAYCSTVFPSGSSCTPAPLAADSKSSSVGCASPSKVMVLPFVSLAEYLGILVHRHLILALRLLVASGRRSLLILLLDLPR